jgi:hypothetical protein
MKAMIKVVTLSLLLLPTLSAINFKVTRVDAKEGKIRLLLPMHSMVMEAKVVPKGEKIPLKRNEFYEGKFLKKSSSQPKGNLLRIKVPDGKPARFEVKRLMFVGN